MVAKHFFPEFRQMPRILTICFKTLKFSDRVMVAKQRGFVEYPYFRRCLTFKVEHLFYLFIFSVQLLNVNILENRGITTVSRDFPGVT